LPDLEHNDCISFFELTDNYTENELKTKYRDLSKRYHPDKNQGNEEEAHTLFTKLGICLDVLRSNIGQKQKQQSKSSNARPHSHDHRSTEFEFTWSSFQEYISKLRSQNFYDVTWDIFLQGQPAQYVNYKGPMTKEVENKYGRNLYSHQVEAIEALFNGDNIVLSTPTSSGKSLTYTLPFLQWVEDDPATTGIFIFPMKALAGDQHANIESLSSGNVRMAKYDGDLSAGEKRKVRKNPPNLLFTNPDMIHSSLLRTHTEWQTFLKNLKLIVIDEIHQYKGIFGSHVGNVLQRLIRLSRKYGGNPQIVCTSATIKDAHEFAEYLTGEPFKLIDKSGAGHSSQTFAMIRPHFENEVPTVTPPTITLVESLRLANRGHSVIVFCPARSVVDFFARESKRRLSSSNNARLAEGYHAGHDPERRRDIEKRLKNGDIKVIFTTSALEVGIDIGSLDVVILYGIPSSNNEIWQRIGRVGRDKSKPSLVLSIYSGMTAADNYYHNNPDEFLKTKDRPQSPVINVESPAIRKMHYQCLVHELTTRQDVPDPVVWDLINTSISKSWAYHRIDIRGKKQEDYELLNENGDKIGETEGDRVPMDFHYNAVFITESGQHYRVTKIEHKRKRIHLKTEPEHRNTVFTTANVEIEIALNLKNHNTKGLSIGTGQIELGVGEAKVDRQVSSYTERDIQYPDLKETKALKFPSKWRQLTTDAVWLKFSSPVGNDYILLHTLEHMIKRAAVEMGFCDWGDIQGVSSKLQTDLGTMALVIYDNFYGGIGYARRIFRDFDAILGHLTDKISKCPCDSGCPECIYTESYCDKNNFDLDKNNLKHFLLNLPRKGRLLTSGNTEAPPDDIPKNTYHVGDKLCDGWRVESVEDEGILAVSINGEMRIIPYED
jgi:DEAD/DEAH box helicase domain-containing protein